MRIILIFSICLLTSCVASKGPQAKKIRALQKGRQTDDSSFVYRLPYQTGKTKLVVQGYYSRFSHRNRVAIDFKMRKGTRITAARDGVVVRLKEDSDKGGLNRKFRQYGNNVVIEHSDGTRAGYWHLKQNGVLVNLGDRVQAGQVIALSGKTGYSAFPHLHFLVWTNKNGQWQQVPTRFQTTKGPKYLRPFRRYKNR